MKSKKCPYCGRRVSYISSFSSRRKAEYVCTRCGKESKVVVSKAVLPVFALFVVIAIGIIAAAFITKSVSNPIFIALVAIPMAIFMFISPAFLRFEPLKKYKKSMEARKAGIEYSDNLTVSEFDKVEAAPIASSAFENTGDFKINSDVFNKIKAERTAARASLRAENENEISSGSVKINVRDEDSTPTAPDGATKVVPIIENVRGDHASTSSAPLRRIHSNGSARRSHYIPERDESEHIKIERRKPEGSHYKEDGNRYSANRKF